jgi:curved DNA-binding protein CbpA
MPGPLLPEDDLYARLEVSADASPEAIELAWRALLRRHHPDVAGDHPAAVERAKRINVAHDWLSDPALRARYDGWRRSRREEPARPAAAPVSATAARRAARGAARCPVEPPRHRRLREGPLGRTSSEATRRSAWRGSWSASSA